MHFQAQSNRCSGAHFMRVPDLRPEIFTRVRSFGLIVKPN
jgi:hypothetical protein